MEQPAAMQLTRHAIEKCATYGVAANAIVNALQAGETFIDLHCSGTLVRIFWFQHRPWVAVLNPGSERVITVYPTDQRTVDARRNGGRWVLLKP